MIDSHLSLLLTFITLYSSRIAEMFSQDLVLDPKTRSVDDVKHIITAIASSSSEEKAKEFSKKVGADKQSDGTVAKTYGSYEEFVKDDNVDIVYIATPHSHHYQNALLCLEAGKNVCCEVSVKGKKGVDYAVTCTNTPLNRLVETFYCQ
jgi:dihydrodiol dehydrogenase / D-xylose 1-dehydrogenase (NADP)